MLARATWPQRGQSAVEYLVVVVLMLGIGGWMGGGGGLLETVLQALRGFHFRFAAVLALPL
ncbi:hypothetical protein PIGHUM_03662 [Pigmentiphaga humi]|uniref:Uncharacterized protein n=1 Tax=Pigmentiphaga humi TaxID=2478468 RepID=A0A3P4B5M5_9BURK|nr:hypothetical protein [Pigmentiphaga humi]VCU71577.1 hypothetical protein PIGHUM_03662 [Pigmentiphaga humi]